MAKQERADNSVSAYWLIFGALLAFGLSFVLFSQASAIVPKLALLLPDRSTADSTEAPVDDQLWLSGEHTADTDAGGYGWATSPVVQSPEENVFLRGRPTAQIQVSCGNDWEFVSIEFSRLPEVMGAIPIAGGFVRIGADVEWDGDKETVEFLQERGSKTMSFSDGQAAITRLAQAETMRLTLTRPAEEITQFEFPLKGSSAAINRMWSSCR